MGHLISVSSLIYRFIGIENDSNSNTQSSQRHYLLSTAMKKCQITNHPLLHQTSWDTNRTTPIHSKTVYKKQRTSSHVTETSQLLDLALFVFVSAVDHAVSSHLFVGPWHSMNPEPKIHLFLFESKPHFCPASCPWWLPTSSTHYIPPTITRAQSFV